MGVIKTLGPADDQTQTAGKSVTSSSGGVVALGVLCALRHGKWAAWPAVPVPTFWLLAPILVADLSAFSSYTSQLGHFRDRIVARSAEDRKESPAVVSSNDEQPRGFELAVALAACE